ncbi:MAG TPA: hypothetical protein VGM06_26800 [Polyangiaceae bacterium]|jgi:hypothetical protein
MTNVHEILAFALCRKGPRASARIVPTPIRAVAWVIAAAGLSSTVGCGSGTKAAAAPGPAAQRSEKIEHEKCDTSGAHVEAIDTNGDGRADIHRVYDGSQHELCRVVDLNHDGKTDLYEYFDAAGNIRRREFCYDDTGDVNAVEVYQGGKLTERAYDTTGQHRIDTWEWFDPAAPVDAKTGRPAHPIRRERDVRGSGAVDQWWTWNGDQVTISTDRNGDGRPDPASTLVLGGGGDEAGAPVASAQASVEAGAAPTDGGMEGSAP